MKTLIHINQLLSAQILSLLVDFVSDFKIGERPRREKYMRMADFAVAKRSIIFGEREDGRLL